MKKGITIFLTIVMCLSLSACGGGIPDGMSEAYFEVGEAAVEAIDEYLEGNLDKDDLKDKLDDLGSRVDTDNVDENSNDVSRGITSAYMALLHSNPDTGLQNLKKNKIKIENALGK